MILSGEKKEEFRESKPYWISRLEGKEFDIIRFKNGYSRDCPEMDIEFRGCKRCKERRLGLGDKEEKEYLRIRLGEIRGKKNC